MHWLRSTVRLLSAFASGVAHHPWRLAAGAGAVVVVLLGVGAALAYDTLRQVRVVQTEMDDLRQIGQTSPILRFTDADQYAALLVQVEELEARVGRVQGRVAPLRTIGWVPGVGPRVSEARLLLDMGGSFTRAVRLTVQGLAAVPAALALAETDPTAASQKVRDAIVQGQPLLVKAETSLLEAREARKALVEPYVFPTVTGPVVSQVDQYAPLLALAHLLARESPDLLAHGYILRLEVGDLVDRATDVSEVMQHPETLREMVDGISQNRQAAQEELLRLRPQVAQIGGLGEEAARLERLLDDQVQLLVLLGHVEALGRAFLDVADVVAGHGLLTEESGSLLGEKLAQAGDALTAAEGQLQQVQDRRDASPGGAESSLGDLGTLLGALDIPLERLEDSLPVVRQALALASYALGYDAPHTFLVVAQNNDEIRATGGFIGVVAELTVERGALARLRYLDSTEVDSPPYERNPKPPEAVYRYLWMARYLFRDANWNPHFPASAVSLADIYETSQGVSLDGVVAVTKEVVLDMVEALGGVRVAELPQAVDRQTVEKYVEGELTYPCRPRHGSGRDKRCFDQDLFDALLEQARAPQPGGGTSPLVPLLFSALEDKGLLLHLFDPAAAEFLWHRGWNGAVRQVDHDYSMVVDSSLPGHAFSLVERSMEHRVTLEPGEGAHVEVRLRYRHRGTEEDPVCRQAETTTVGCYWDYVRLLIPAAARDIVVPPVPLHGGSEWLIWGYPDIDSARVTQGSAVGLGSVTEIGAYLAVEPGTEVTMPLEYHLPWTAVRQVGAGVYEYKLLIQKQPGTRSDLMVVLVALPPGGALVATEPAVAAREGDWLRFDLALARDRTVQVTFSLPPSLRP